MTGIAACAGALRLALGRSIGWLPAVMVLVPGIQIALLYGQTSLFVAAILVIGLTLADRRPSVAGAVSALLVAKPHLALLIPVAFVSLRQWRALVACIAFAGAYLALTLIAFGVEPWRIFFKVVVPRQLTTVTALAPWLPEMLISPYLVLIGCGASPSLALGVQIVVAAISAFAVYWSLPRLAADPALRLLVVASATLLASPYMQVYEFAIPGLAALAVAARPWRALRSDRLVRLAFTLALVAPVACIVIAGILLLNPAPVLLLAILGSILAIASGDSGFDMRGYLANRRSNI
jgi:alpha-1,2-mannosyltransferase